MTSDEAIIRSILLWAINPDAPVPHLQQIDEERLVNAVAHHRIAQTLLLRLQAVRPDWCRPSLLTRLRLQQFYVKNHIQQQIAYANEITRAVEAEGSPPIFVKGFAGYALTNRLDLLHYSGDLDPFAADLPRFWDVLHTLGYVGKRKFTHEWAKLQRPGAEVVIDIHESFPIQSYPDDLRDLPIESLSPSANSAQWQISTPSGNDGDIPVPCEIVWDDLYQNQTTGQAAGTKSLHFPSPEVLCLIHCAHALRCALTRFHYLTPHPRMRLSELLTIQSLSALPTFDTARFEQLTLRWQAQDAVRFVNTLAVSFLGKTILPGGAAHDTTRFFLEHLPYGGWIALQTEDDFLLPGRVEQTITQLDAPIIKLPFTQNLHAMSRLLVVGQFVPNPRFELSWVSENKESLILTWILSSTDLEHGQLWEFVLHLGSDSFVRVKVKEGEVVEAEQKSDYLRPDQYLNTVATMHTTDDGRVLTMQCPIPELPSQLVDRQATTVPLLCSARIVATSDPTAAVCYIPLRLDSDSSPE